jgi:uncharacterized protein YjbI with pentapeptide repeats
MSYHKCAEDGCPFKPIAFTHYCWQHVPDKKTYLKKLRSNIESSVAPINLDKIVLEEFDLSNLDLKSASFVGAAFISVDFSHSNFSNANFKRSYIQDSKFIQSKLIQATPTGSIIINTQFADVDFSLVQGNLMKVKGCTFDNLFIKTADLKNSFWKDVVFKSAQITDGNFMMSYFDNLTVHDSKLDNALCSGSQFYKCNFNLNDLIEMNFIGCLIDEAEFKTNMLQNCRFATAILRDTLFDNCKLTKPIMRETQIINGKFNRCSISDPMLQRAVLIHTNLNLKKIANANTEGLVTL